MTRRFGTANEAFNQIVDFLEHFTDLDDPRQRAKVLYPLDEAVVPPAPGTARRSRRRSAAATYQDHPRGRTGSAARRGLLPGRRVHKSCPGTGQPGTGRYGLASDQGLENLRWLHERWFYEYQQADFFGEMRQVDLTLNCERV